MTRLTVLTLVVLLLAARPAAAHTELVDSTPSAGELVQGATAEVVLTFSGRVQGDFSTVAVTGPDGTDRARGPVAVRGGRVVQAVDGPLPAGAWEVAYRVIAADGHPVTGTVPFTVAADRPAPSPSAAASPTAAPSASAPAAPGPSSAPTPSPAASSSPSATAGSSTSDGEPDLAPAADQSPVSRALAPTAAVLAVAAAAAAVLVRRSRRS